jgi:hypothetical protein
MLRKNQAIIHINHQNAIIAKKETLINSRLTKTKLKKAFGQVQKPIPSSLFATLQIALQFHVVMGIVEFGIIMLMQHAIFNKPSL